MMVRTYTNSGPVYWIFQDRDSERIARLEFHIEKEDYFPFLASVFGLLKDSLSECDKDHGALALNQTEVADETRKDLIYVYEHYDLVPRKIPRSYSKKKTVLFDT